MFNSRLRVFAIFYIEMKLHNWRLKNNNYNIHYIVIVTVYQIHNQVYMLLNLRSVCLLIVHVLILCRKAWKDYFKCRNRSYFFGEKCWQCWLLASVGSLFVATSLEIEIQIVQTNFYAVIWSHGNSNSEEYAIIFKPFVLESFFF